MQKRVTAIRELDSLGFEQNNRVWTWGGIFDAGIAGIERVWLDQLDDDYTVPLFEFENPEWSSSPGHKYRLERIDLMRNGMPGFLQLCRDYKDGQGKKRHIDNSAGWRYFKLESLYEVESCLRAKLGEELSLEGFKQELERIRSQAITNAAGIEPVESLVQIDIEQFQERARKLGEPVDPDRPARVYIIRENSKRGHFKVGFSQDPSSRIASLQTGNPYPLELYAESMSMPARNAFQWEQRIHRQVENRMEGEWFHGSKIKKATRSVQHAR